VAWLGSVADARSDACLVRAGIEHAAVLLD